MFSVLLSCRVSHHSVVGGVATAHLLQTLKLTETAGVQARYNERSEWCFNMKLERHILNHAIASIGKALIFQQDNDPELTVNAVKAHVDTKK